MVTWKSRISDEEIDRIIEERGVGGFTLSGPLGLLYDFKQQEMEMKNADLLSLSSYEDSHAKFVAIEGGDFCGKTTFQEQLIRVLRKKGLAIAECRSPGGLEGATESPLMEAEKMRELFVNTKFDKATRTCLSAANRVHITNQFIKPSLKQGLTIICSRWRWSADVYQDVKEVSDFIDWKLGVAVPDLYILLECTEEVMRAGLEKKSEYSDLMDKEHTRDYLAVKNRYRQLYDNWDKPKFYLEYNKGGTIPTDEEFELMCAPLISLLTTGLGKPCYTDLQGQRSD